MKTSYNEEGLIIYLCKKAKGIGYKTGIRVAGFMEDFKNFCQNTQQLTNFKTSRGKNVLTDKQILQIKKILKEYVLDCNQPIRELWISVLIKDFVKNSINELRNTSLDTLLINPFLVKAFGFDDHKEVVTFYFYQKITRSVVTSWGFIVEGLLLCSGAETTNLPGFDIKVEREDKTFQFQIKSSPNTMSIEQVRQLNTHIKNINDKISNIPILGMTYGTRKQINNQIQSTLIDYPNSTMIGKELWDFISNDKGYCMKLFSQIEQIMDKEPTKFSEELDKKRILLIKDWENNFGVGKDSINFVLKKYL